MTSLGIKWEKIKLYNYTIEYIDNGKRRHYTPDFLVEDNFLLEIKGFYWGDDKRKMRLVLEQSNTDIKIIEKVLFHSLLATSKKEDFIKLIGM